MTRENALSQVAPFLSYFNDCKPDFAIKECKSWINKIYDDFEKELKQAWIDGSDANYKALKEAGKLK